MLGKLDNRGEHSESQVRNLLGLNEGWQRIIFEQL